MAKDIFRKAALERLASPEKLDAPVRLVGASGWLVVLAFGAAIAGGVAWATTVKAPVKVTAQGILIDRVGLVEIVSERGGLLESVDLAPGDIIEAGQIVARMSQSELRRDLAAAKSKLADGKVRYQRLETFYAEQKSREGKTADERRATIERTRALLVDRLVLLDQKVENIAKLVARKLVLADKQIDAEVAASDTRERIAILEEEALRLNLDAIEKESSRTLALLDEGLEIEEKQRDIVRLNAQLSDQQVIRSSHAGRIAEVKINPGDVVQAGTALATLARVNKDGDLVVVLYVPPAEGKRVEPGMPVQVSPSTVEREVFGFIQGQVTNVAPLPATPEGMRRTLQNDQLVTQLSTGGAPIEVRVQLDRDPATQTGFAWSSSQGPAGGVNAGTLVQGRVIIDNVPLADLVLPGAAKMMGMN